MKYMISGASGFIGQALHMHLVEQGHTVLCIPRDILYVRTLLKSIFERHRPDYIVHLAAYGNHAYQQDVTQIMNANITGTFNMLEASKDVDYKKFYNISSSSVTLPCETFYSASKAAAERIANVYWDQYGKPVVNVRPYSVYGPGEADFRFIPKVIKHLFTGEEMLVAEHATHDWIYIDDFITALLAGETEIGTGIKTSNRVIVATLEIVSSGKLNYSFGDMRIYDNPNWVAKKPVIHRSLFDGLKLTYEYYAKRFAKGSDNRIVA